MMMVIGEVQHKFVISFDEWQLNMADIFIGAPPGNHDNI